MLEYGAVSVNLSALLSTAEVATQLGVTRQRVLELIKSHRLRAKKVGRSYVIHSNDLSSLALLQVGRPPKRNASGHEKVGRTRTTIG